MTGISLKIGYAACFGRSKGTPPGATKTDLALLEGPRDSQGAEKLGFCMCDNISLEPLAHSLEKTLFLKIIKIPWEYMYYCVLCHHPLAPGVDEFGLQAPPWTLQCHGHFGKYTPESSQGPNIRFQKLPGRFPSAPEDPWGPLK